MTSDPVYFRREDSVLSRRDFLQQGVRRSNSVRFYALLITSVVFTMLAIPSLLLYMQRTKLERQTTQVRTQLLDLGSSYDAYLKTKKHTLSFDNFVLDYQARNFSDQPEINGGHSILVDIKSGDVLYDKSSQVRRPIASLTKIMTFVVALEHADLQDTVIISDYAASIGENSMGLQAGEEYTMEELLYGLMLNSGNDAAYAIAEHVAGNWGRFVQWMNFKAQELGLSDTFFADPSGLDDHTYSTPKDLVFLTVYGLQYPTFREIVKTVEKELPATGKHGYVSLFHQTNLLTTYPGVAGVKTGYTEEAGLCLVTYINHEGHEFVGVVLGSADRKGDMILMLDHGFWLRGITVEHNLL